MSILKYYDGTEWKMVNGQIIGDTLPIGAIIPYGSGNAPTNWLVCDGSAVSRTTYAELFSAIGTSFGAGDGSTTFNLPNLKGRVPVGQDSTQTEFDTMGETGGEKTHTLIINEMPSHNHTLSNVDMGQANDNVLGGSYPRMAENGTGTTSSVGGGQAHNNLQPYQVVCYIIKAKQSAGVVANVSDTYSTSQNDTYSCDYINDAIKSIYSTTETQIGTYLGKPLYRSVIQLTANEYNALDVASGRHKVPIETLSVDRLLRADLITNYIDGTKVSKKSFPSHSVGSNSGSYEIGVNNIEDDNLMIVVGSSILSGLVGTIDIIIEYTKTTD